jgi:hypothetical protein
MMYFEKTQVWISGGTVGFEMKKMENEVIQHLLVRLGEV